MATRTTTSQSASSSTSSGSSSDQLNNPPGASTGLRPPSGDDVTIVFTDIARAASLWEFDPRAMRDATLLHNALLRYSSSPRWVCIYDFSNFAIQSSIACTDRC
jgi:class 3 adenylate cyclase